MYLSFTFKKAKTDAKQLSQQKIQNPKISKSKKFSTLFLYPALLHEALCVPLLESDSTKYIYFVVTGRYILVCFGMILL